PERRDAGARAAVENAGGRFRLFPDALLVEPDALATASGDPSPASPASAKKWLAAEKHDPLPRPADLATPALRSVPLEKPRAWRNLAGESLSPRGGATAARALLNAFFRGPAARY